MLCVSSELPVVSVSLLAGLLCAESVLAIQEKYRYIPGGFRHHKILTDAVRVRLEEEKKAAMKSMFLEMHEEQYQTIAEDMLKAESKRLKHEEKKRKKKEQKKILREYQQLQDLHQQRHPEMMQAGGEGTNSLHSPVTTRSRDVEHSPRAPERLRSGTTVVSPIVSQRRHFTRPRAVTLSHSEPSSCDIAQDEEPMTRPRARPRVSSQPPEMVKSEMSPEEKTAPPPVLPQLPSPDSAPGKGNISAAVDEAALRRVSGN